MNRIRICGRKTRTPPTPADHAVHEEALERQ